MDRSIKWKQPEKNSDLWNTETTRKSPATKSPSKSNHPRQIQLSKSIVDNIILNLGLLLAIVERDAFIIKFMN